MYFLLDTVNTVASTATETASFWDSEFASALLVSGFTILGVFIGAHLSNKSMESQETMRLLAEFYSETFSTYTAAAPFKNQDKLLAFLASAEKTKLLCSEESEKVLNKLEEAVTEPVIDIQKCGELLVELRESAKKDLRKR